MIQMRLGIARGVEWAEALTTRAGVRRAIQMREPMGRGVGRATVTAMEPTMLAEAKRPG